MESTATTLSKPIRSTQAKLQLHYNRVPRSNYEYFTAMWKEQRDPRMNPNSLCECFLKSRRQTAPFTTDGTTIGGISVRGLYTCEPSYDKEGFTVFFFFILVHVTILRLWQSDSFCSNQSLSLWGCFITLGAYSVIMCECVHETKYWGGHKECKTSGCLNDHSQLRG